MNLFLFLRQLIKLMIETNDANEERSTNRHIDVFDDHDPLGLMNLPCVSTRITLTESKQTQLQLILITLTIALK